MEQTAALAERASIKYKQVEFMADKVGQEFDGIISGITEFGLYVELNESKCEGMVPLRDLDDDYYDFDERNYCLVGRRRHHKYQLGDAVRIKVASANLFNKQLDYELVEHIDSPYTNTASPEPFYASLDVSSKKKKAKHTGKAPKVSKKGGHRRKG